LATAALGLTNAQGPTSTAAESAVNSVAFIDGATGRMTAQLPLSDSPTAIAADGRDVWAVEPAARAVARVDSAAHAVIQTVPVGNDPSAVVVADGSVWVANHDDGTVSRISPETDQVVQTIQVGTGPLALADGSGSVWVTNGDDRTVTRIDEQSGRVIATIHTNAVGRGIAVAAGAVWVTDEATGRILEVDPTTNTVSGAVSVGNGPTGVTQADGQVWVVNSLDGTVDRIDPTDQAVTLTLDVPGGASSVSGGDGSVWVGSDSASQVSRIDAAHGTITGSTPVTTRPEAVFALPSGVWFSGQAEGQGHRGGRLVVAFGDIDSIDPAVEDLFPDPVTLAYDGLTATRSAGGSAGTQIVPDLAMSIPEPTDDGRTFTFHLRRDLKYSDGTTLQPSDFRLGLERLLLLAPDVAGYFSHVVGAQQCTSSTTCDLTTGVTVSGSSTVTFHLTSQDGRFPEELGLLIPTPAGTPLRDIGTAPIPGTGPYAISEYAPGRLLTFDRNRYFNTADAGRPDGYPDQIVFDLHPDEDAAAAVAAGRADLAQLVTGSPETAQLRLTHPGQVHTEDDQATVSAFLNVTTPPFDDVRVRRALNLAVDRARIVRSVGADLASPTCQILAPTTNGYRAYCPYTADPGSDGRWRAPDLAAARALVRASGTAGEAVTVWTFSDFADPGREVAHALDELGYDVKLHEIADSAAYFRALDAFPGIQVGIIGWYGSPLAIDTFTVLTCGFAKNRASFCNRNIDAQIQRLARAEVSDPAGSIELAAHIDRELTDLAPWVPLFNPEVLVLTSARVGNYQSERADLRIDQLWVQ
jgi:YVTN family beta-propeller protein